MNKMIFETMLLAGAMALSTAAARAEDPAGEEADRSPRAAMKAEQERSADSDRRVVYDRRVELSEGDLSRTIKDSASTLQRFLNDPARKVPPQLVDRAQCVAVFPSVTKAALVVGGEHGTGVVTCRGPQQNWSQLGFLHLTGAGLGAQLGAKDSSMVFFFMNDRARTKLESGDLSFGADLSVAVGDAELVRNIDNKFPTEDVVAFAESDGAFIGASLDGVRLKADEQLLAKFYDENARYQRVIATYDAPGHPLVVKDFIQLLPRAKSE